MIRTIITGALFVTLADAQDPAEHPVRHDRTGIAWRIPFEDAQAHAKAQKRLLMIKPVAFGTTADGCW